MMFVKQQSAAGMILGVDYFSYPRYNITWLQRVSFNINEIKR